MRITKLLLICMCCVMVVPTVWAQRANSQPSPASWDTWILTPGLPSHRSTSRRQRRASGTNHRHRHNKRHSHHYG